VSEPRLVPLRAKDGAIRAYALVDEDDFFYVSGRRWYLHALGYAFHSAQRGRVVTQTYMHRWLLGLEPGDSRQADHINRNRLDNRRANLRIVETGENSQNLTPRTNDSSKYRGVWWHRQRGYWVAAVQVQGVKYHVGTFASEDEAGAAATSFRERLMTHSEEFPV
jgi:hypothetical protein